MYYEVHLIMRSIPDALSLRVYLTPYDWHYSCIDGDIVCGDKAKLHYVTKHFDGSWFLEEVEDAMNAMADSLKERGCLIIRRKIEMVVYDRRTVTQ